MSDYFGILMVIIVSFAAGCAISTDLCDNKWREKTFKLRDKRGRFTKR